MTESRLTNEQIVEIFERHEDEMLVLWEELIIANGGATPRDAVEEWLRRQVKPIDTKE